MTDLAVDRKLCRRCGETKPLSAYYKASDNRPFGVRSYCKDCDRRIINHHRMLHGLQWDQVVTVTTEDELRAALTQPEPFYAEAR